MFYFNKNKHIAYIVLAMVKDSKPSKYVCRLEL